MKSFNLFGFFAAVSFITTLSGCNGGMNLTVPSTPTAEGNPVIVDPNNPPTDSTPTPTPNPGTSGKNRIFVSAALVTGINGKDGKYFDSICTKEAKSAKIIGNFAALVNTNLGTFGSTHKVNGTIYQKIAGIETRVADSFEHLIAGKNDDSIIATARQGTLDNSYKNYVWTGQNNFNQPPNADLNCNNWTTDHGYGIVGQAGARGSDALAIQTQTCNVTAHLYCIETN